MIIYGLILARGGSKRVPNKNIRVLGNKPLLAHSIDEIKKSKHIDRLFVTTNDDEIAEVAKKYGAEVPFRRPETISGPDSTEWQAFFHAIDWFKKNENITPDIVVLIRPTTPFRKVESIDKAIELLKADPSADSVRSVTLCTEHPHKMWKKEGNRIHSLIPKDQKKPEAHTLSYHLLPETFIQNASFDVIRVAHALKKTSTTGTEIIPIEMNEEESMDINSEIDFDFCEMLLERKKLPL